MKLTKRIFLTLLFPVLMFLAMWAITAANPACYVNGKFIFLGFDLVRFVILNACQSICVALAIWMQLKNGRFDFSNGAAMILTAIIAGNVGLKDRQPLDHHAGGRPLWHRPLRHHGRGLYAGPSPRRHRHHRRDAAVRVADLPHLRRRRYQQLLPERHALHLRPPARRLLPTLLAMGIFLFYSNYTVTGRKGKILANNQAAGVNIGIWEEANVSQTAMFTGAIVGLAATIYVSQNQVLPQSGLSTAGIMFSYIVPVYMGMFIGLASNDVIGISIAAIGMAIFNYGLNCMNLGGGGWQQIIMGVFVMCFYTFSAQLNNIKKVFRRVTKKEAVA